MLSFAIVKRIIYPHLLFTPLSHTKGVVGGPGSRNDRVDPPPRKIHSSNRRTKSNFLWLKQERGWSDRSTQRVILYGGEFSSFRDTMYPIATGVVVTGARNDCPVQPPIFNPSNLSTPSVQFSTLSCVSSSRKPRQRTRTLLSLSPPLPLPISFRNPLVFSYSSQSLSRSFVYESKSGVAAEETLCVNATCSICVHALQPRGAVELDTCG